MKNQKTNRWKLSRKTLRTLAWLSGAMIAVGAIRLFGWLGLNWPAPGLLTLVSVLAGGVAIATYRSLPEQGAPPDQPHNR